MQYYIDFKGKKLKHLKTYKQSKTLHKVYKHFDSIYKDIVLFFPYRDFYIFRKKYISLLNNEVIDRFDIIVYDNIWFKIHKNNYKHFIIYLLSIYKKIYIVKSSYFKKYKSNKLILISNT